MKRLHILCLVLTLTLISCGGRGVTSTKATGGLTMSVSWPGATRVIPPETKSISVDIFSGTSRIARGTINRPTSTLTINDVLSGPVSIVATAYDGVEGTGNRLFRGGSNCTVETAKVTTANVTLDHPVQFSISTFQSSLPISLWGSSKYTGGSLRLAGTSTYVAGSAWTNDRFDVAQGFLTEFDFKVTNPGGTGDTPGADGFTFCIQNASGSALGGTARDLGYGGISHCLAIEFDTYKNAEFGDLTKNHISVHTLGASSNSADESASIARTTNIPNLMDGQVHPVMIDYEPGILKVFIDDLANPVIQVPYNISNLGIADGRAYVGFTSSTGSSYANYDIANWFFGSS